MKTLLRLPLSKASSETGLITEAHWDRSGYRHKVNREYLKDSDFLSDLNQELNLTLFPQWGLTAEKHFKGGRKGNGKHLTPSSIYSECKALRSFDSPNLKSGEAC